MPIIRIEYDKEKVSKEQATKLAQDSQKIVSDATGLPMEDIFAYCNSSEIKVNVAPVEIWVEMSAHKVTNADEIVAKVKVALIAWKKENNFFHPINFTLIPMNWKLELGI